LLELENSLEKSALQQSNSSRRPEEDVVKNEEIKQILRRLDVHQAGLLIKPSILKSSVEQSLQCILKGKKNPCHDDSTANPAFVKVDLHNLWGDGMGRNYEAKKIKKIRSFLDANIFMRILYKICNSLCDEL